MTELADSDLDEILKYIAIELMNPDAASAFADKLDKELEELCTAPKTGRPVRNPYLKRTDIRRILVKNYVAYYLIDESKEQIVILRIVYGERDQNEILKTIR